jgi:hypothetical protein
MTYLLTARTSFTVGGDGFLTQYRSGGLVSMDGYGARGKLQYRVSRLTSIGAEFNRQYFEYKAAYGNSDLNNYNVFIASQLGRSWTFSLSGGAYRVDTQGLQSVALSPAVAALLGISSTIHTFTAVNWLPSGRANLNRKFKNASLNLAYSRSAAPGNGVYLSSRADNGTISYSYTGVRKASLGIYGGYSSLSSLAQGIPPYQMFTGGVRLTYNMTHALHAVAGYDVRQQEVDIAGYRRTSYRVSAGIAFSPGSIPLSLW